MIMDKTGCCWRSIFLSGKIGNQGNHGCVNEPCLQKINACCFPEPLVMCTHTLIKINGWLKFLLTVRWGGTVMTCRVALKMSCSYSCFLWLICWQHSLDRFVISVFLFEHRLMNSCHTNQNRSTESLNLSDYCAGLYLQRMPRIKPCFQCLLRERKCTVELAGILKI